jgi:hypothetical protein
VKNIRNVTVRLKDLADNLGFEVSDTLWPFIAARLAGGEVRLDAESQALTYPDYIPVDQMVRDVLDAMSDGRIEARACAACAEVVDMNKEEGIFGDPESLERFICSRCADTMSAREFYEKHLKTI